jgi:S1-C subfamily serine protease
MKNAAIEFSDSIASLVEANGSAVVRVEGRQGGPASGSVWSADGVIVTTSHAIEREEDVQVGLADGSATQATVVGRDAATDLAVLRVTGAKLTAPTWGDLGSLKVGNLVLALARPGRTTRASLGLVNALGPSWRAPSGGKLDNYLQADISLYPGFSGGTLSDLTGKVLGMTTRGLLRRHSLAIPTSTIRRVVDSLLAHGKVRRGFLGVGVYPVRLPDAVEKQAGQHHGALVLSVQPGSAADKAGIVQGDVLLSLDGQAVGDPGDLLAFLDEERVGAEVTARLARGGSILEVKLTVGTRS